MMNSIDYHVLAAFRHELSLLELNKEIEGIDTIITYIKSRIHELERKLKQS